MGLNERIQVRISKYEKEQLEKYRIDSSMVCRMAIRSKIREFVTDPQLIINAGDEGPAGIYTQAWSRIMPGITSMLTSEDYQQIKNSSEKLNLLKQLVSWSLLKNIEIQFLAVFLEGGDISERILMACIEAHL